jgi:hypothetical protein
VEAHKLWLMGACETLRRILENRNTCHEEEVTVVAPDFRSVYRKH